MAVGGPHDFPNSFTVLIKNHDGCTALVSRYVIFMTIHLSEYKMSSVVISECHEFTIARRINLRHFIRTIFVVVKELGYITIVIFPSG